MRRRSGATALCAAVVLVGCNDAVLVRRPPTPGKKGRVLARPIIARFADRNLARDLSWGTGGIAKIE